jgi:hypothetical protein
MDKGKVSKQANEAVPIFLRSESCLIERIKDLVVTDEFG